MEGIGEECSRRTLDIGLSTAEPGATTSPATVAAHSTSTHTEVETRPVGPAIRDIPTGLADLGTVVSLTRGTAAYHEGDPASHWYRMVSGTGCTSKLLSDGRRQIGRFLHAEDFSASRRSRPMGSARKPSPTWSSSVIQSAAPKPSPGPMAPSAAVSARSPASPSPSPMTAC